MRIKKLQEFEVSVFFVRRAERNLKEGKVNSYYRYRSAMRAFEEFAGGKISLKDVTREWLEECETHFREKGLSYTSINIYMKALKAVMNEINPNGKFPFGKGKYEIPSSSPRKLALTKDQIRKLINFKGTSIEEKYRDLWLFSYLCNGINFRDLLFLKYSDIENGEICFIRAKTKQKNSHPRIIRAVITQEMQDIMVRLGNGAYGAPDAYIFPFATPRMTPMEMCHLVRRITNSCNRSLRNIAIKLRIPPFTTYSARHSFATILQRSGVEIDYISECLGHSNLEITRVYLAGFDKSTRMKNARKLL